MSNNAPWQAGLDYALGTMVVPRSAASVIATAIVNAGFESGDTDWTKGAGWAINNAGSAFEGSWRGIKTGSVSDSKIVCTEVAVVPGQKIRARCMLAVTAAGTVTARVGITWRNAAHADISSVTTGTNVGRTSGNWRPSVVEATAPALAAYAVIWASANTSSVADEVLADSFTWNYSSIVPLGSFLFEATVAGISAATEPTWPSVAGGTVVDGTVTWTARAASRVTWKAVPILKSGTVEPVWPTAIGASVADGSISWRATNRVVEDSNCPHSPVVIIATSKVYAVSRNGDVVRYCATVNPRDWTTIEDAGYLPTGMNFQQSDKACVLNLYRAKLAVFTSSGMQLWDIDEDPANNALFDTIEGIGSIYNRSATNVVGDLFMLTEPGVRSVGIAAGAENFQAGDIGMPIDDLVQEQMTYLDGLEPIGFYYPGAGQFCLAFPPAVPGVFSDATTFVYTMNRVGQVGAWSRYVTPFTIKATAQLGKHLYVRNESCAWKADKTINYDEIPNGTPTPTKRYFNGIVQWPWLEVGRAGQDAMMESFDIIGDGTPTVQFGYDQRNHDIFTDAYVVDADTLTGFPIAMPLTAPSISTKITYVGAADNFWALKAFSMYFTN
jgi:hypothetical protein